MPAALLASLLLAPTAHADDGVAAVCLRLDKAPEITCRTLDGGSFDAVPAGHRLDVVDVVVERWNGALTGAVGDDALWTFKFQSLNVGDDQKGVAYAFEAPLPLPAGGRLRVDSNGGDVLLSCRLVAVP